MTYASLTQVKAALRITDNVDDTMLQLSLNSTDEAINAYCGRTFGTAAADTVRYYASAKADYVEVDDLQSITTVEYSRDGVTWQTTTDYQAEPLNSFTDGMTWPVTRLRAVNNFGWYNNQGIQSVKITGKYAFGSVPSSVVQAAVMQASRLFKRADSPLGVAGFGDIGVMRVGKALDPDVEVLLTPYRRLRAAL